MKRSKLLEKLDKATDRAARLSIDRGYPIPETSKRTWVGNTVVEKNKNGLYDILTLDKKKLYSDITVLDVATIVAQRHSSGEFGVVKKVLALENTYSKHHTDMIHYLHCFKGAKRRKDYDSMAILEDKFQISEIRAKKIRDSLSIFKRVK